ncbi:fungal specific transcription factor domain-containing protein [Aspergillus melleus]|uniref:fungal specific transcription factor domain-containing protein n=1 Tax=Aspergillus melleus TaxID=138277 RepID=UPI001E8D8110|nr:uncharacterized protein LDX57_007924 [Aspergillus melleus]KAH8430255.1 hypothetical protein LDX57_007924 [Aspergillus melleus]
MPLLSELVDLEGLVEPNLGLVWSDMFQPCLQEDLTDMRLTSLIETPPTRDMSFSADNVRRQPALPLTPSAVTEIYDGRCSPRPEQEAMGPRDYHPTVISVDAQLSFPDLGGVRFNDIDSEDLAHVAEVSQTVLDEATRLTLTLQTAPSFPPFLNWQLPPRPILNSWVQLYFEHFHPIFPLLHKRSFGGPATHWLLTFAVAAIGAQFSRLPESQTCARAMQELIRRFTIHLCEHHNRNGRELWLTQVVLLNQIAFRYSGERRALEIAEIYQALPITLARRKQLCTTTMSLRKISELELPQNQRWQIWILDEERRRTGIAVWLLDSAFRTHFDLTRLMGDRDMQNTLPQREELWEALTTEAWASLTQNLGTHPSKTLPQLARDGDWIAAWNATGTLGKHAILQLLINSIYDQAGRSPDSASRGGGGRGEPLDQATAEQGLRTLLTVTELPSTSPSEVKANTAHRIGILGGLMMSQAPGRMPLLGTALRLAYRRDDEAGRQGLAREWRAAPHEGRMAVVYAAQTHSALVIAVGSGAGAAQHFSFPVLLFRATLVLWLFSTLAPVPPPETEPDFAATPSVILGCGGGSGGMFMNQDPAAQARWVETGFPCRLKLAGIGNFMSATGRARLLEESLSAMRSLRGWGINAIYEQLLDGLRCQEN